MLELLTRPLAWTTALSRIWPRLDTNFYLIPSHRRGQRPCYFSLTLILFYPSHPHDEHPLNPVAILQTPSSTMFMASRIQRRAFSASARNVSISISNLGPSNFCDRRESRSGTGRRLLTVKSPQCCSSPRLPFSVPPAALASRSPSSSSSTRACLSSLSTISAEDPVRSSARAKATGRSGRLGRSDRVVSQKGGEPAVTDCPCLCL